MLKDAKMNFNRWGCYNELESIMFGVTELVSFRNYIVGALQSQPLQ